MARSDTFVCPWWLIYSFDNVLRRLFHIPERLFSGLVLPGHHCLDLGCGIGYFTIPLARLVGREGVVTAVDIQQRMLDGVSRRAERAGVHDRINVHLASQFGLNIEGAYDFALAFWMLHEVPDQDRFLTEVRDVLKPGGRVLLAEPRIHVSRREFERSLASAREVGMVVQAQPSVRFSRAAVLCTKQAS
ncbi:MAG: class I SAM-dependent methyltransferase [Bacteroidota bacterium]